MAHKQEYPNSIQFQNHSCFPATQSWNANMPNMNVELCRNILKSMFFPSNLEVIVNAEQVVRGVAQAQRRNRE